MIKYKQFIDITPHLHDGLSPKTDYECYSEIKSVFGKRNCFLIKKKLIVFQDKEIFLYEGRDYHKPKSRGKNEASRTIKKKK